MQWKHTRLVRDFRGRAALLSTPTEGLAVAEEVDSDTIDISGSDRGCRGCGVWVVAVEAACACCCQYDIIHWWGPPLVGLGLSW